MPHSVCLRDSVTRDGHGLGPSMGWVGSHLPAHVMGWVGLNEKYCYFFTAFYACYNIV